MHLSPGEMLEVDGDGSIPFRDSGRGSESSSRLLRSKHSDRCPGLLAVVRSLLCYWMPSTKTTPTETTFYSTTIMSSILVCYYGPDICCLRVARIYHITNSFLILTQQNHQKKTSRDHQGCWCKTRDKYRMQFGHNLLANILALRIIHSKRKNIELCHSKFLKQFNIAQQSALCMRITCMNQSQWQLSYYLWLPPHVVTSQGIRGTVIASGNRPFSVAVDRMQREDAPRLSPYPGSRVVSADLILAFIKHYLLTSFYSSRPLYIYPIFNIDSISFDISNIAIDNCQLSSFLKMEKCLDT